MRRLHGARLGAAGLALLAGGIALALSVWLFPFHSVNHDEAVYLQQAAMLLDGQLFLRPPVPEAFRPWFFVRDGARLYPKYAPVTAAIFAAGELLGSYRLALGAVAAAATGLSYAVVAECFDRRTGLLAAALLVASPLFLVQSATFLPYLPTTTLNLAFALAYLRADRTGSLWWAAAAGALIGLAFFARPYTAVLFAAPFVVHALATLRGPSPLAIRRHAATGVLGLAGVGLALGYNALVTGSPLLFPYEAFAPRDGLGFGRRALLDYEVAYTPALAFRANAEVLWLFFVRWVVAGPLGAVLAAVGLGAFLARHDRPLTDAGTRRLLLAGLAVSVVGGNLYFWGNLNLLGDLARPADGLGHYLGPYYHVDLLLPTVAFAAHGSLLVAAGGRQSLSRRLGPERARRVGLAGLVLLAAVGGGATVTIAADPIADNRAVTERLATAYAPFEDGGPTNAVVFLPTPHGDWLNHPFQALRNDPSYDGPTLYAIEERPFAVADAFPERRLYRYRYDGVWAPTAGESVEGRLRPVRVVEGERLELRTAITLPPGVETVSIRLTAGDENSFYAANRSGPSLEFRLVVGPGEATLRGDVSPIDRPAVGVGDAEAVTVEVFGERADTSGISYRIELPVETGSSVRAMSPRERVCTSPLRCDDGGSSSSGAARTNATIRTSLSGDRSTEPT